MKRTAFVLLAAIAALPAFGRVLIVADEIPAMEVLAGHLKTGAGVESTILKHPELPADMKPFDTFIVYVHRNLDPAVEHAAIDFANNGGKLVLLHHTISSAKRKNKDWFPFLGVRLDEGDVSQGGYKWIEGVEWEIVNLAPKDGITTRGVDYPAKVDYKGRPRPGFKVDDSEVYLNHHLSGPRTILLGLKFKDPKTGVEYQQDTAGWYRPAGKGWVMYFMAGHSVKEFGNPAYIRILVNAIAARLR